MNKLSILIAAGALALATPVFACPGHDTAETTKTAEKAPAKDAPTKAPATTDQKKDAPKATTTAKAKEQPKQDTTKKPTKVSQK